LSERDQNIEIKESRFELLEILDSKSNVSITKAQYKFIDLIRNEYLNIIVMNQLKERFYE